MQGLPTERRTDPRRGIAVRVGLALTAVGIASAANERRALTGAVPDAEMAIAFGLFVVLLLVAGLRRPPRGATQLAFAAMATVLVLASFDLGSTAAMLEYVALALGAAYYTASHLRPFTVAAFALWTPALWLLAPAALSPSLWMAALAALAFAVLALLDPRRVHPSDRLRHAGYAILAVAIVSASAGRTLLVSGPGAGLIDVATLAAAILLPLLAYGRLRPPLREGLATAVALIAFALIGLAYLGSTPLTNDAAVGAHRAAELLLSGSDPYATFDLPDALARAGLDPALATHLEDGSVLRTYSYPALSFLAAAPVVAAGIDIRLLYLVEVLLIGAIAARHLRAAWRSFALATLVGSEIVARQTILAGIDPSWALFALAAWVTRERRWISAILLGLAIADRQPAWFLFPFFVVAVAHRTSWPEAVRRAAIALGVALAIHLPFLIGAPARTVEGILAPVFAPLVSDGVGLMQFGVTARYTTFFPRTAYTVLALVAFAALLALLWRRPRDLAGAALSWPLLPLYLAWRSLQNYFTFVPLFAIVGDDELAEGAELSPAPPPAPRAAPRSAS